MLYRDITYIYFQFYIIIRSISKPTIIPSGKLPKMNPPTSVVIIVTIPIEIHL